MPTIQRKNEQTDLTAEQWTILQPLIILPDGGRPKTTDLRQVMNAIFYQLKTGCQWRLLPHALPKNNTALPKAPSAVIFTTSNAPSNSRTSTKSSADKFEFKRDATKNRVWQSLILKVSKPQTPQVKGAMMQEKKQRN